MTTLTLEAVRELRDGCRGVSKGPWFYDSVRNEGAYGSGEDTQEGFQSYVVYSETEKHFGEPAALFDATNSNVASVEEERDEEHHQAWDEQGRKNMAHLAKCSPEIILALTEGYLAMVEALEIAQVALNDWIVSYAPDMCAAEDVVQTEARLSVIGTLGYITTAAGTVSAALAALKQGSAE